MDKRKRMVYISTIETETSAMTKLPARLAAEFCADYVEEIPYDVRRSALDAIERMNLNADKFSNADWHAIDSKQEAILSVADAWLQP